MSSYSSMFGPAGKNVQRGEFSTQLRNASASITVAAVNPAKTLLLYSVRYVEATPNATGVTVRLESSTTLRIKHGYGTNDAGSLGSMVYVEWQLVELF